MSKIEQQVATLKKREAVCWDMTINDHADAILRAAFPGATVDLLRDCWDNERDAILAAGRAVYEYGRETALRAQIDAKMEQHP